MLLRNPSFGILSLGVLLVGCETADPYENLKMSTQVSSLKANKTMQPHVAQAFLLLKEGKYSEASKFINQTLQAQPKSVILHILNGLTYEKLAEQGDGTGRELAIVGYQNAINLDPSNIFAITQMGKLRYRDQQYDQAQEHFANALLLKPNDPDLLHEFAASSYYAYDIKTALAAIRKAEKLKPEDPLIQRSAAMMYAAVGDFKNAKTHFDLFQAKVGNDPEVAHVANRFNDWQSLYKSGTLTLAAQTTSGGGGTVSGPVSGGGSDSGGTVSGSVSGSGGGGPTGGGTVSGSVTGSAGGGSTGGGTVSGSSSGSSGSGAAASSDKDSGITIDNPYTQESDVATKQEFKRSSMAANVVDVPLSPDLPAAGAGGADGPPPPGPAFPPVAVEKVEPNQQIIVDCYVLKIVENASSSKGNNILQNLNVTLNPGSYLTYSGSMWGSGASPTRNVAQTFTSGQSNINYRTDSGFGAALDSTGKLINNNFSAGGIGPFNLTNAGSISGQIFAAGITWAGLTYNLNIANANDSKAEVVSRPTLMTFLHKESRFFSGEELVNVASGNYGSNLSRYQIGLTLAVTPDSLVGDTVTLGIGVEQSILETVNPNLLQTITANKTKVETTARVRLGETIMLGGLYERSELVGKSGFPGLRDVPFLQYFFSNETTSSARTSVMILMTPRSPDSVKSAVNRAMARESVSPQVSELLARNPDWFNPGPNAVKIFNYMNLSPKLYYEFRTGDILPPSWSWEPSLHDRLGQLASFLYY